MPHLIHKHTQPQTITQKHKLVLELRALFTRASQELNRGLPLGVRKLRFTRESVKVIHEGGEELERAGSRGKGLMEGVDTAGEMEGRLREP